MMITLSLQHVFDDKFLKVMTTLIIHPANSDQDTAIRVFLDALHVEYKTGGEMAETEYLNSSPALVEQLNTAMDEEKRGEGKKISLDEIWK